MKGEERQSCPRNVNKLKANPLVVSPLALAHSGLAFGGLCLNATPNAERLWFWV